MAATKRTAVRTCSNCAYWKRGYRTPDGEWNEADLANPATVLRIGVCRLNPPVALVVPKLGGDVSVSSFFPFGHENDWCGQHAPSL